MLVFVFVLLAAGEAEHVRVTRFKVSRWIRVTSSGCPSQLV